jgi:hypothetical protein
MDAAWDACSLNDGARRLSAQGEPVSDVPITYPPDVYAGAFPSPSDGDIVVSSLSADEADQPCCFDVLPFVEPAQEPKIIVSLQFYPSQTPSADRLE